MSEQNIVAFEDEIPIEQPEPGQPAPPEGGQGEKPKGGEPDKAESRKLHEENARLKRESEEARAQAEYWSKKAEAADRKPAPQAKAEEPEDDDPDKFIAALTTEGPKALKKYLKPGASLEEIAELIDKKLDGFTGKLSKQSELVAAYPDLAKSDSRLHEITQEEAAAIVKRNPAREGDPDLLFDAARIASLRVKSERDEEDRNRRVRSASGYGGESYDDGDGEGVGEVRMTGLGRMLASRFGISEKDYLAAKKTAAGMRGKVSK